MNNEALSYENYFSNDAKARREYERYEDAIREEKSKILSATQEGFEQGMEKGIEKTKRDNIINGLRSNIDINIISAITGASLDTIEQIKKDIAK